MALKVSDRVVLGVVVAVAVAGPVLYVKRAEIPGVIADTARAGWDGTRSNLPTDPLAVDADQVTAARAALPRIRAGAGPLTGYTRSRYGPAWADVDRNGCSTRDDVLARDLTGLQRAGRCTIAAGTLPDPYTGRSIRFVRGGPSEVDIDHVVSLAAAWRGGAATWATARRELFANDPGNLLAVDAGANRAKGDSGPADWRPRPAAGCLYGTRYTLTLAKYGLAAPSADKVALGALLRTCPTGR